MEELLLWMPILVTLLATIGAALTYLWQKKLDRRNEFLQQRRKAYTALIVALNRQITNQSVSNLVQLNEARAECFLVSSDEVAKSTGRFFHATKKVANEEKLQGSANDPKGMLKYYAEMVLSMRHDCFEKSNLNIAETMEFMPIEYSGNNERVTIK